MTTYLVDGQRIYAREEGPDNAQVALLIHGWSSSWYALSCLLPVVSRRFACVAVDLPGYGNSPPSPKCVSMADYADLLAKLIRTITDRPVVLIGHSMGGMISIYLALRHPVLVERLVLICPTITGHLSTSINAFVSPFTFLERFSVANHLTAVIEPHILKLTDSLMRPVSFADRTDITEETYKRLRADARRPGQGRVRFDNFHAMRQGDLRGKLRYVESPSLVLWGAEDNTVPLRDAGVVADEWPNADLRIIPKAGHWPQFETPDLMIRYVASYLGLPVISSQLDNGNMPIPVVGQVARFLNHSDVGNGMNLAQRMRLASQCDLYTYEPGSTIAHAHESGSELYIVQEGSVEVWTDPISMSQQLLQAQRLATFLPGQITGELALLDGGRRSANLRAGSEGATVLSLKRERVVALCEDDPPLGTRLIWNVATALALRLRLINWQMEMDRQERENQQTRAEPAEINQSVSNNTPTMSTVSRPTPSL
ncbi:MAG: alpha/beta fold hydrolase [Chloroflexaceae bacterium]|nr:alpha/beta fold hydrolase [Chloroflexaceae bacterium]